MHVRTRVGEAGAEDASLLLGPMPRRLPLRRQALPVPRQQQQQQQQHKQAVVQNQGRTPDLGNCPHLQ